MKAQKETTRMRDVYMVETIDGCSSCLFGNASNRSALPGPFELSRSGVAFSFLLNSSSPPYLLGYQATVYSR